MAFATIPVFAADSSTTAILSGVAPAPKMSVSDKREVCLDARFIVAGVVTPILGVPSSRLARAVISAPPEPVFDKLKLSFVAVGKTGRDSVVIACCTGVAGGKNTSANRGIATDGYCAFGTNAPIGPKATWI